MSVTTLSIHHPSGLSANKSSQKNFRINKMHAALAMALGLLVVEPAFAAEEKNVSTLEAEIARLKKELETTQRELAAQKNAGSNQNNASSSDSQENPQPTGSTPPSSEPAKVAAEDQPADLASVVVRGRNRLERVQDIPASISVITGKDLETFQARDLASLTQRAANVSWNQGNARTGSIAIRGIGKQAQTDAMDPSVGVTVDGVSYAYNPLTSFDFYDVDTIEVARGPQGTSGGKNSSIGAITINTRRPSFTDHVEYSLALGQNDRVIANAAATGAVVDGLLAWRGSLTVDKGQGDYPNKYNEDFTYKNKDNVSGRVQFLLTPTENIDALFKVEITPKHEEYYNGWTFFTPTPTRYANGQTNGLNSIDPLVSGASRRLNRAYFTEQNLNNYTYQDYLGKAVFQDNQRPLVTATNGVSSLVNWRVAGHTLTSITAYKDFYFQARNDEGTPYDISKNGGGYVSRNAQYSQEFRLASDLGGKVDYQTGLYLLKQSNNYESGTGFGQDAGAWFASNDQYNALDVPGVNRSAGRLLLKNSLGGLETSTPQQIETRHAALYGNANWHISEPFSIATGARLSVEHRENSSTKFIQYQGAGADLNPASAGGFNANAAGALSNNNAAQLALADQVAQKYYGVNYAGLSTEQMAQIGNAKALRAGQIGTLYGYTKAESINDVLPTLLLSPNYKFNDNVLGYVSFQYGEKGGIAQVVNGKKFNAEAEKNKTYEIGLKSVLFNKTLTLNTSLFLSNIENYQQQVQQFDPVATALTGTPAYTAITGNVKGVRAQGLEIDGVFSGISNTLINFSGAYNDAYYTDFKNSRQPVEASNIATATPTRDVTGENLPGAAKFTFNVGANYRYPVFNDKLFHAGFNTFYTSRFNSDIALSSYAWVPAYSITDLSIGIGRRDKKFDASIIVKNLFDDDTAQVRTWNSYVPSVPRWVGVVFSGEL